MVQNISFHLFFSTSLSLAGNSCRLNWARHISHKRSATRSCQCVQHSRAALPIPVSVCSIQEQRYPFLSVCAVFKSSATRSCQCVQHFHLSKLWYGCQCWGFLTCAQMLVHAITHGGCAARTPSDSLRPSIAFRHLPPNSARFSYATEGALFISAQLSSDAVSALRKVPVLI